MLKQMWQPAQLNVKVENKLRHHVKHETVEYLEEYSSNCWCDYLNTVHINNK